jgi:serine/threonine-protein kinase
MIGETVGSYRIVAKLGEGGMGAVYLGEHEHIARKAAIKVLLPELSANKQIVARFFNEARATSLIRHPGIVEIIDCSVLPNGNAYIVMEYLTGESLGSHLRAHGRVPPSRALALTRQVAAALSAAHSQHIIHRDLKPDNVFVLAAPDPSPIKILDFGIAKLTQGGSREGSQTTRTGALIGTPAYMSPEQCRGAGAVDHRTDIYSLGCIAFEMLCGRPPFTYEGFGELIQAHLSAVPPRALSLEPSVSPEADALIARLLAKSPDDRPQTMNDVIEELDAAAAADPAPTAASPPSTASDRTAPARPAVQTLLLPENQKVNTTLGSASSERMSVVTDSIRTGVQPSQHGRRPLIIASAAVVMAGVAGFALWPRSTQPLSLPPATPLTKQTEAIPPVVAPSEAQAGPPKALELQPKTAPEAEMLAERKMPPGPKAMQLAAPAAGERKRTPTAQKVTITISSEPAGVDVCLAKDHVLLGKTTFEWSTDKVAHQAKLLLRKRGYRGREVVVPMDHDTKKQIVLTKLGLDDLDDTDSCERR